MEGKTLYDVPFFWNMHHHILNLLSDQEISVHMFRERKDLAQLHTRLSFLYLAGGNWDKGSRQDGPS